MTSGCGVTYKDAIKDAVVDNMDGVQIPFASAPTLWRMKQTARARDIPDRLFLRELLGSHGVRVESSEPSAAEDAFIRSWRRLKTWWQEPRLR